MATLALQAAGSSLGSAIGGPLGASLGASLGGMAGKAIDTALFGTTKLVKGPKLKTLDGLASTPGSPIPRIYGRVRLGGQMIWATNFEEVVTVTRTGSSGGKSNAVNSVFDAVTGGGGGSGASSSTTTSTTTYSYYANFAIAICEGPISFVRRIWADGKEINRSDYTIRFYGGEEGQMPDPLIIAKDGAAITPAYRGIAYLVFERFPLAQFGNRVPQFTFEIVRAVNGLAQMVQAVNFIPGATEFGYASLSITALTGLGQSQPENTHQLWGDTDFSVSLQALKALCPNLKSISLVVAWFGTDERAEYCQVLPKVEIAQKTTLEDTWSVAGLSRDFAQVVSTYNGAPAYGGTPSDDVVISAIHFMQQQGWQVVFYPFIMMDIPFNNSLPSPYNPGAAQASYPWRGRITCDPAPGVNGTVDGTPTAALQINQFIGSSSPSDSEWSFRRFILHCAQLCQQAGNVSAFLIGSELPGLTRVRSASGVYPMVDALVQLASDVKAMLGAGTKVSFAADWTEYGAHVINNGAEIRFPLDKVWGSPAVDFVGIDVYWPLSDWRDGVAHQDAQISSSIYQKDYLVEQYAAGLDYDYYYATEGDRAAQIRTPITDGAYNKPWIYRVKDLVNWWSNTHHERVGGQEIGTSTNFVPMAKPIWITEVGCPAVDRGTNSPNIFPDPKSSESGLPPFSRGMRDDLMQVRALEAVLMHFTPGLSYYNDNYNPYSPIYGGQMVDTSKIFFWTWDARPFPAFPNLSSVWADAANWATGHWITGRIEGAPLDHLYAQIFHDYGLGGMLPNVINIDGFVEGYTLDSAMSLRDALQNLSTIFGVDAIISSGAINFSQKNNPKIYALQAGDFVANKDGHYVELTRLQETDLPYEVAITFNDSDNQFQKGIATSRNLAVSSKRQTISELPASMISGQVQRLADVLLQDIWAARESASFMLNPNLIALEIGDCVSIMIDDTLRIFQITHIIDGLTRKIEARAIALEIYDHAASESIIKPVSAPQLPGPAHVVILDLAIDPYSPTTTQYIAAFADPWPGALSVWRSQDGKSFAQTLTLPQAAIIGTTLSAFPPGFTAIIDTSNTLDVMVSFGSLSSVSDTKLLNNNSLMAIQGGDGAWEIFGFANADLIAKNTYRLSRMIRGLGGESALAQRMVPAGATVVFLDNSVQSLAITPSSIGMPYIYKIGPATKSYADPAYVTFTATATVKALLPYAPVEAKAVRGQNGITISFKRRDRHDNENWELYDIPMSEASEAYVLRIYKAEAPIEKIALTAQNYLYPAAQELADFGALQTSLTLSLTQVSAIVGEGYSYTATIPIN